MTTPAQQASEELRQWSARWARARVTRGHLMAALIGGAVAIAKASKLDRELFLDAVKGAWGDEPNRPTDAGKPAEPG